MTDQEEVQTPPKDFKDRKTGLIVFGIILILMGVLCALMIPLVLIGTLVSASVPQQAGRMQPNMMMASLVFYVLFAVFFFWLGIGSIKARRWARALILIISWYWLLTGILALAFSIFIMPPLFDSIMEQTGTQAPGTWMLMIIVLTFMVPFYLLLPGAFVLFYMGRNVTATCERYDPKTRWTDRCPLPVLAVSLAYGCAALFMPFMAFYRFTIPFFGTYLTGTAGAGVALILFLLCCYLCWGFYKLSKGAWWLAVCFMFAATVSTLLTTSRLDWMELYEKMGMSAQQLQLMERIVDIMNPLMTFSMALTFVIWLLYLLFIRKYYPSPVNG